MANSETRSAWHIIQEGVQDTEKLISQSEYNLSMIKARQTLEVIVKQLSGRNMEGEQGLADIIDALYTDNIISKLSCEHYHKIRAIGNKAVHENNNDAYSANVAYSLLSEEVQTFIHDYSPKKNRTNYTASTVKVDRPQKAPGNSRSERPQRKPVRERPSNKRKKSNINTSDLIKVVTGFIILVILIFLFKSISPIKKNKVTVTSVTSSAAADNSDTSANSESTDNAAAETPAAVTYVTTARLNVRSAPSRDGDILATLSIGVTLEYVGAHDDTWSIINYNGGQAYVASAYIKPAQ